MKRYALNQYNDGLLRSKGIEWGMGIKEIASIDVGVLDRLLLQFYKNGDFGMC